MKTMRASENTELKSGMAICSKRIPLHGDSPDITQMTDKHPWIIFTITKNVTVLAMASTEHSHYKTNKHADRLPIQYPCPPLDPRSQRPQILKINSLTAIPTQILTSDRNLQICNNEGLFLTEESQKQLHHEMAKYFKETYDTFGYQVFLYDPYDIKHINYNYDFSDMPFQSFLEQLKPTPQLLPIIPKNKKPFDFQKLTWQYESIEDVKQQLPVINRQYQTYKTHLSPQQQQENPEFYFPF